MQIYGPVWSWRLGNSLGIDLVEAPNGYTKICSFDCVYCQLGHRGLMTNQPRAIDIPDNEFELLRRRIEETRPDYITFSGQGESTLNLNLGYAARRIKQMTDVPLAVLTNASFIRSEEVREGLNQCDLVIPKIDAPCQELFERINRPYRGITLVDIIEGIKLLKTKVAIQTLLFSYDGLTNADDQTIGELIEVYQDISKHKPLSIFLGTAHRPNDTNPIKEDMLQKIGARISSETRMLVIYYRESEPKTVSRHLEHAELEKEILELLRRRPCTEEDLSSRFGDSDVSDVISSLTRRGVISKSDSGGKTFYFKGEK